MLDKYELIGFEHEFKGDISIGILISQPNSTVINRTLTEFNKYLNNTTIEPSGTWSNGHKRYIYLYDLKML